MDGPWGFILGFSQVIEDDFLRVVDESKRSGVMLTTFNATFISLVPKYEDLFSFEEFRPISLHICIYKILANIIVMRVKYLLFSSFF